MKRVIGILLTVAVATVAQAQVLTPEMKKRMYKDTFLDYDPELDIDSVRNFQQKEVLPDPPIREADVLWSKRVWREIEVAEKVNLPLYYPLDDIADRKNLFDVLRDAYQAGLIQAFDSRFIGSDEFRFPIPADTADAKLFSRKITLTDIDEFGETNYITKTQDFEAEDVVRYRIKEDWYFDKQRSELRVKILGIMPICKYTDEDGTVKTQQTAWFYFPEVRHVLVNYEAFNRRNKTQRITFDDIFRKRYFSSHIIKEENVYDRSIASVYTSPYDQLLKSEEIKQEIFNFEHDLWSY
ncbi:type IX secretion system ring subunit PorN/GldN [Luteibaculum oceani]|uniref:Gliding motility protein GldN n=1 Tax=Luteibaculum oceani TaxID=1294296 RepID=A0A5C6V0Z3_9FLAO|nr:gliding motility protein GldN [Luteibaculum oceani]TXC78849.1 gliding motility protein GldN [Luteibaculum oceani]